MRTQTSPYRRKDGTKKREYICANVRDVTGVCSAPRIEAGAVEKAFIAHLDGFFLDFDAWMDGVTEARTKDLRAIEAEIKRLRERRDKLTRELTNVNQRWVDAMDSGDKTKEGIAYETLEAKTKQREALDEKLGAREPEATALAEADDPVDSMLDYFNALSASIRGSIEDANGMAELADALARSLAVVELSTLEDGRVKIEAQLRDRGEYLPRVDEDYQPTGEADFVPDSVSLYLTGSAAFKPPVRAIEATLSETGATPRRCDGSRPGLIGTLR